MIEPMQLELEYPMLLPVNGAHLHIGDCLVRITVEWDETVSGKDWYISSVDVYGCPPMAKDTWHELPQDHELARKVTATSYGKWHEGIQEKWEEHLLDEPVRRRKALRLVTG